MRVIFYVISLAVFCSNIAFAQDMTAEQRAACKADYDKFCKGTMPGGGRIIACLSKHNGQLADACKKVVESQKK